MALWRTKWENKKLISNVNVFHLITLNHWIYQWHITTVNRLDNVRIRMFSSAMEFVSCVRWWFWNRIISFTIWANYTELAPKIVTSAEERKLIELFNKHVVPVLLVDGKSDNEISFVVFSFWLVFFHMKHPHWTDCLFRRNAFIKISRIIFIWKPITNQYKLYTIHRETLKGFLLSQLCSTDVS